MIDEKTIFNSQLRNGVRDFFTHNEECEPFLDEMELSKTASNLFEVEITDKIREFLDSQSDKKYRNLNVQHYEESDLKYHSDVFVENPTNGNQVWIEVKKNKYANLGGLSMKYRDGEWTCTTTDDDNPLNSFYLKLINENAQKFIQFCKDFLGRDDIKIPTDITDELLDAWKVSGNITDTENETQFITDKIIFDDFGSIIKRFYQTAKLEPVYYMQVGDDLYIIDGDYNPLNLRTKTGAPLKTIEEAYRIGRVQFRVRAMNKNGERYFSVVLDVKTLSDKEHFDSEYECSFDSPEKWPIIGDSKVNEDIMNELMKDEQKIKSTNDGNPDGNIDFGGQTVYAIHTIDGRIRLTDVESYDINRVDRKPLRFDTLDDAIRWGNERNCKIEEIDKEHNNWNEIKLINRIKHIKYV